MEALAVERPVAGMSHMNESMLLPTNPPDTTRASATLPPKPHPLQVFKAHITTTASSQAENVLWLLDNRNELPEDHRVGSLRRCTASPQPHAWAHTGPWLAACSLWRCMGWGGHPVLSSHTNE